MEPESLRDLVQGRFVDALGIVAAQDVNGRDSRDSVVHILKQ